MWMYSLIVSQGRKKCTAQVKSQQKENSIDLMPNRELVYIAPTAELREATAGGERQYMHQPNTVHRTIHLQVPL